MGGNMHRDGAARFVMVHIYNVYATYQNTLKVSSGACKGQANLCIRVKSLFCWIKQR
jgi:hypothetical protein